MKVTNIMRLTMALFVCMSSCETIDIPKIDEVNNYNLVYMPAAVSPVVKGFTYKDTIYKMTYGAGFGGGEQYPSEEIVVNFEVHPDSVVAYNQVNDTQYEILPPECYELTTLAATIAPNTVSTEPLSILINPSKGMELFKTYLLPVSIRTISGNAQINRSLATAYYLVTASLNLADFDDFDRSNWTISDMSSEEETGEGPNNGRAIFVLDDDFSSFWHTRWNGGNAPPPHYLAVDMGELKTLRGISIVGRPGSNSGRPEVILVEVRTQPDEEWTVVGNVSFSNVSDIQRQFFNTSYDARQVKITIVKNFNNMPFTHLANLNLF
ncbi:BT_3987 domain-containing protein [Sphingobacterium alkalisoli]|nr:DUF1735 domain-containing protein [Sphingobacterium alkalisoli]